jgi:hypothetical protein
MLALCPSILMIDLGFAPGQTGDPVASGLQCDGWFCNASDWFGIPGNPLDPVISPCRTSFLTSTTPDTFDGGALSRL